MWKPWSSVKEQCKCTSQRKSKKRSQRTLKMSKFSKMKGYTICYGFMYTPPLLLPPNHSPTTHHPLPCLQITRMRITIMCNPETILCHPLVLRLRHYLGVILFWPHHLVPTHWLELAFLSMAKVSLEWVWALWNIQPTLAMRRKPPV